MEGGDDAPGEDEGGDVDVGREDFPEEGHPFEDDVGDVEGGEGPFVPVFAGRVGLEVFVHAGDFCIADVCWSMLEHCPGR